MSSSTKIKSLIQTPDKEKKVLENIQKKHQMGIGLSSKSVHNNNTAATSQSTITRGRGTAVVERSSGRVTFK